MSFVGADGCKKGWFVVKLTGENKWQTGVFEDICGLWEKFKGAKAILIDIPIGLKEEGVDERECDVEARRLLHNKRASSVFRSPCRKAVYSSIDKASKVNFEAKSIWGQSYILHFTTRMSCGGGIRKKVGRFIFVFLVDLVFFVSLVRLETNFALPGNSF
jgi:predicted RNase H-like nuclease